jgi:Tfp pilus assembly PilM family ATPase
MRILGLEFGSWSLKAVEMESRFRRVDILELHEIRMPLEFADPAEAYRRALQQLMSLLPSHPERVVTSLPAAQTALRFLQVPIKQRRAVEKMYQFELEDSLPFKLEDSVIEHSVHRSGEGSLVFAAVAPKRHVVSFLEWLKAVGLDPDWLTFDGMGMVDMYFSSLPKVKAEWSKDPVLLLDLGHTKTNMAITHEDRLEFFRTLSWGGAHITKSISLALGMNVEEAEQRKISTLDLSYAPEEGSGEPEEVFSASTQALAPLITDIGHSLVAFRNQHRKEISEVRILGGTSLTRGIQAFLEESLGCPVTRFQPEHGLKVKGESEPSDLGTRFAEPVGRAFVFARKSALLFNFRRGELAKETSLNEVTAFLRNPSVLKILAYAGALAAILFVNIFLSSFVTDKEVKLAKVELEKTFQETFRSVNSKMRDTLTSKPDALKKYLDQKNMELKQKVQMLSKDKSSMLTVLAAVSTVFPKEMRVDVNTVQMDELHLTVEGVLYQGEIGVVENNLKQIPRFSNVEVKKEGQRFTIRANIAGK